MTRREIYSLSDGEMVIVDWPANIGWHDYEDLSAWLDMIHAKIARAAAKNKPPEPPAEITVPVPADPGMPFCSVCELNHEAQACRHPLDEFRYVQADPASGSIADLPCTCAYGVPITEAVAGCLKHRPSPPPEDEHDLF